MKKSGDSITLTLVNWFLALPLSARTAIVFLAGLFIAGQINRGIYRLAWNPRLIGPWSKRHDDAPPRQWWDRIPVVGWFGLMREEKVHGTLYWFRPLAIEIAFAAGLAMLYQWEDAGSFNDWRQLGFRIPFIGANWIHSQFLSHVVLLSLMMVATFIDFDEKTIPDSITIPGTTIGLLLATFLPWSMPSTFSFVPIVPAPAGGAPQYKAVTDVLWLSMPQPWPAWLNGVWGLVIGLVIIVAWWYALLPKRLTMRFGMGAAVKLLTRSIVRSRDSWNLTLFLLLPGLAYVVAVWCWGRDGLQWQGLLTGLIGLAFGGGLVWAFRVVASWALQQEALGFGDVTLMAMIGTYVGWQASLLIFFLAPFAGAVVGVLQWLTTRKHEIAYGPYLCVATVFLMLGWVPIWGKPICGGAPAFDYFKILGIYIPVGLLLCLVAMAAMLSVWFRIKRKLLGAEEV